MPKTKHTAEIRREAALINLGILNLLSFLILIFLAFSFIILEMTNSSDASVSITAGISLEDAEYSISIFSFYSPTIPETMTSTANGIAPIARCLIRIGTDKDVF